MTDRRPSAAETAAALDALLGELVTNLYAATEGALGAAISVRRRDEPLLVVATHGIGERIVPAQVDLFGGPVPDAAWLDQPVRTDDVFADPRWPKLTFDNLVTHAPAMEEQWSRIRGIAALPTAWDDTGTVVLSVTLDRPADAALAVLARYERLVAATLVVGEAASGAMDQMIDLLRSRAAIEEAKGAIIAVRRCSPDEAWETLRRTSQEFNVKLRELAVALVEYLSRAKAPQPVDKPPVVPGPAARRAAEALWAAFTAPH